MLARTVVPLCRVMVAVYVMTVLFESGSVGAEDWPFVEVAPGQLTSLREVGTDKPFVAVGVNYFGPHTGWAPKIWQRFDPQAVGGHLKLIRQQGFNTIRVFLTLESFHREAGQVHEEGVAKFRQLLGLCRELGIRVVPSGPDHWEGVPQWIKGRDMFADEEIVRATESWWASFAALVKDDPTILAWDLLNEPAIRWDTPAMKTRWNQWLRTKYGSVEAIAAAHGQSREQVGKLGEIAVPEDRPAAGDPRLYDYQLFRESIADQWTRRLVAAIRGSDPSHLITVGQIQWAGTAYLPSVRHYAAFNLKDNARHVDFTTIHFYPIAPPKPCDAPNGIDRNGVYLEVLLSECSVGKPVMIGEFAWYGGGEIRAGDRVIMPRQTLEDQVAWNQRLLDVSRGRVCGWLHWAFADTPLSQDLTRRSGLWTEDLQLKPWGRVFGAFASEATRLPAAERRFDQPWADRQIDRRQVLTAPESGGEF